MKIMDVVFCAVMGVAMLLCFAAFVISSPEIKAEQEARHARELAPDTVVVILKQECDL